MIIIKNEWGLTSQDRSVSLIFLVGLIDDFRHLSWWIRLVAQLIAITGVIFSTDLYVEYLGEYPVIGPIHLGPLSVAFTVVAVAGVTNAFNLIDGINGLCGGLLLVPLVALAFLCGENCVETLVVCRMIAS